MIKINVRYAVVIDKAEGNYSAYMPDLPGWSAIGDNLEEIKQMMRFFDRFSLRMNGGECQVDCRTVQFVSVR